MTHFCSSIMSDIRRAVNADMTTDAHIDFAQGNGAYGINQALVTIASAGGETRYRMLLAPIDAPLGIVVTEGGQVVHGHPIDDHFIDSLQPVMA